MFRCVGRSSWSTTRGRVNAHANSQRLTAEVTRYHRVYNVALLCIMYIHHVSTDTCHARSGMRTRVSAAARGLTARPSITAPWTPVGSGMTTPAPVSAR